MERLPGGPCTHWKAPPLHGAHPERPFGLISPIAFARNVGRAIQIIPLANGSRQYFLTPITFL